MKNQTGIVLTMATCPTCDNDIVVILRLRENGLPVEDSVIVEIGKKLPGGIICKNCGKNLIPDYKKGVLIK